MFNASTIISFLCVCITSLLGIVVSLLRYEFAALVRSLKEEREARQRTDALAMIAKDKVDKLIMLLRWKGSILAGELDEKG